MLHEFTNGKTLMKEKLTKTELLDKFQEQLDKLRKFNRLFDEGDDSIASEMAVKLRILFYNTRASKSMLKQLRLEHVKFVDTASSFDSRILNTHLGLVLTKVTATPNGFKSEVKIKGDLAREIRQVDFENWWDGKIIIRDKYHKKFTRKNLIVELANRDGGAHVDEGLDVDYKRLTRDNSVDWFFADEFGKQIPMQNPVPVSVRQISFETLQTFGNIDLNKESKLFK